MTPPAKPAGMALVDYVDIESADDRTRELLEADADYYDRPSLFARAMANDPDAFAARGDYHRRLVVEGDLDTRLCELAYFAVSQANDCPYCVASHAEKLVAHEGVPPEGVDAIVEGDLSAFDDRERAVVEFAQQVATDPKRVSEAHLEALREVGFDDGEIVRLLTVATAAVAANAIADALNVHPADRDAPFEGDPRRE
jgi:uncharacterized peroxidase-related enzyme